MKPRHLVFVLLACAALYAAALLTRPITSAIAGLGVAVEGSFPLNGQHPGDALPYARGVRFWGSWGGNDANNGTLALGPFPAPRALRFAVGGYPTHQGNELYVELAGTPSRLPVKLLFDVGEKWRVVDFIPPPNWIGKPITLHARDNAKALGGWLALSEPIRGGRGSGNAELFETLAAWSINGLLLGLLWFTALRLVTAHVWVAPHWASLVAAAAVAASGYVAFWAYFANATFGIVFSCALLLLGFTGALRRGKSNDQPGADALAAPKLLFAIGLFYVALLHFFPSSLDFHSLAANRHGALPGDNTLPRNVAYSLFNAEPLRQPGADWLSSDRPPLQSGWMLLTWPVTAALALDERTAGGTAAIWLQSLWVLGAYGLLRSLGLMRARAAAWVAVMALAGFFAQNTVFTWPKLSAAAFACGAFGLWTFRNAGSSPQHGSEFVAPPSGGSESENEKNIPPEGETTNTNPSQAPLLIGALLAALAWLSHGGVAFSFLALAPWLAWRAVRGEWRAWLGAAAVFAVFAAPWLAYQKFYDPPGDRLFKWHLAGVVPKDDRGTWRTIRESYGALTWEQYVAHKRFNFTRQFEGDWSRWRDFSIAGAEQRRNDEFFFTARALTWWLLGLLALPIALARGRLRRVWRTHAALAAWTFATVPLWCLLMFSGGQAVIHQGSYAVMLGLFVLLSAWLELASPWTIVVVGGLQLASFATTWAVSTALIRGPLNWLAVAIAVAAAVALVVLVVREHWRAEPTVNDS